MVVNTINPNNKTHFRSSSSLDWDGFAFVLSQLDQGMIEFLERLQAIEVDMIHSKYDEYIINRENFIQSLANVCQIDPDQIFQLIEEHPQMSNSELYAILIQQSGLSEFEFFKRLMIENEDIEALENLLLCEHLATSCDIEIEEMMDILVNPDLAKGEIVSKLAKIADLSEFELVQRFASNRFGSPQLQSIEIMANTFHMSADELVHAFDDLSAIDEKQFIHFLMEKSGMSEEEVLQNLASIPSEAPEDILDVDFDEEQDEDYVSFEELEQALDVVMEELIEEFDTDLDEDDLDIEDFLSLFSK